MNGASTSPRSSDRIAQVLVALIVAALAALFHFHGISGVGYEASRATSSLFVWVQRRWIFDPVYGNDFPFGWAAPLVSLWMVWRLRAGLRAAPKRASWAGFAVVLMGLLVAWTGVRAQQPRLSAAALLLLAWGIPFHLFGWPVARRLALPAAFLVFTLPFDLLGGLVLRLRAVAAAASAVLLSGFGLPMTRVDATTIRCDHAPDIVVAVSQHAGGLRSLMLVTAAAVLLAWLRQRGHLRQALLVLSAPVIVLAASVLRTIFQVIAETTHLAFWPRGAASGPTGLVFYAAAFALLGCCHAALRRGRDAKPGPAGEVRP